MIEDEDGIERLIFPSVMPLVATTPTLTLSSM
jgi:hypothetical protein